ncbi:DUF4386 domain-containing protein [Nocardioides speluncae]|uniref:DUF4386 domain-containing protein n=1 Tax=Nocardioides speluncae TaxID=2670337 RepID=UPI00137A44D6|nr:DUF4386 domain-containing protein [Nocardioides speluncae]
MADTSPQAAARAAGASYIALFFLGFLANFLAVGSVVHDDPRATFTDLAASQTQFRAGIAAFLVVLILDIVIAWGLLVLLREVRRDLALLAAWFRLVYTAILGLAVVFLYAALQATGDDQALSAFTQDQLDAAAQLSLDTFEFAFVFGLACFGVHLILIGRLVVLAGSAPTLLGRLLMVAGAAYAVDGLAHILLSDYERYADAFMVVVAVSAVVAEVWLGVWLVRVGWARRPLPDSDPSHPVGSGAERPQRA